MLFIGLVDKYRIEVADRCQTSYDDISFKYRLNGNNSSMLNYVLRTLSAKRIPPVLWVIVNCVNIRASHFECETCVWYIISSIINAILIETELLLNI